MKVLLRVLWYRKCKLQLVCYPSLDVQLEVDIIIQINSSHSQGDRMQTSAIMFSSSRNTIHYWWCVGAGCKNYLKKCLFRTVWLWWKLQRWFSNCGMRTAARGALRTRFTILNLVKLSCFQEFTQSSFDKRFLLSRKYGFLSFILHSKAKGFR